MFLINHVFPDVCERADFFSLFHTHQGKRDLSFFGKSWGRLISFLHIEAAFICNGSL